MSRVGTRLRGAGPMDPSMGGAAYFIRQGSRADLIATKYGSRAMMSTPMRAEPAARARPGTRAAQQSVGPVKDINGLTILAKDEHMASTRDERWPSLQPSSR